VPLSAAAGEDQRPQAAIADDGEILVAWQGPVVSITAVQVARRSPAGAWSPTPADISLKQSSETHLVMDGRGNATALWLQPESIPGGGTALGVAVASRAVGGTWTMPRVLTPVPGDEQARASVPDLAVGSGGHVTAIWYRFGLRRVESSTRAGPAASWVGPELVGVPSISPSDRPVIAVDASGTTTASWSTLSSIQANRRAAGGSWAPTTTLLSAPIFPDAYSPEVTVAPNGLTLIAWYSQSMSGPFHLQAATYSPSDDWTVGQELGQLSARPSDIADALDGQANGTAVWTDTTGAIRSRTYDAGGPDLLDLAIPPAGTAGEPIVMSVRPRDRWSPVAATTWEFGDGASARGSQVSHAFGAGVHTVRVTSSDVLGNSTTTTRTLTIAPPPPPPPPPPERPRELPSLSVGAAGLTARFERSRPRGKPVVTVAGTLSQASRLTFVLSGPMRPAGARTDVALGTRELAPGAFSLRLALPASSGARLLPGAYELRATGPELPVATWRFRLAAPKEGVVLTKKMSTRRKGLALQAVTRTKQLWATFTFARGATAQRSLVARWYAPRKRKPIAAFRVKGPNAFSYWRHARGLAAGRWRCVLVAGGKVVDEVSIRVG
jgi:hypothetical protein